MFWGETINTRVLSVAIFFCVFSGISLAAYPYEFELNCPYWYILFNRAGYADITEWYPSERHLFGPHEMMTGDWAAAVWYDGIDDGNDQAQWLTDGFVAPTFNTTQIFDLDEHTHHVENEQRLRQAVRNISRFVQEKPIRKGKQ